MTYDGQHGSTPDQLDIVVQSVNDEPPEISGTATNRQFIEQMGPIELVDENVTIIDLDNCLNHTLVQNITVTLTNPQPDGEDQFIVDGMVQSSYQNSFSCDQKLDENCYMSYLRNLTYNNTNPEPGTFMTLRRFTIEVHTHSL